ncbi:MAG: histone deacetylase family protein [Desulfobacteraceae bacterium]|nr:histone deacetylase family protein [Desulfobacteraceae bacterium]MBC2756501.1 histone deacetylase family protein [Desulfobacteraceae bacterium]
MKVVFDELFHFVYSSDPASAQGRMESIIAGLPTDTEFVDAEAATIEQLELAHTTDHINDVKNEGVYDIAALAVGGAIQTARTGLKEPCFGLIRPPGHHASAESAWGFCYFNNMAVSLLTLRSEFLIKTAFVLDVDLHYGDGTDNILDAFDWVKTYNPVKNNRAEYINEVKEVLSMINVDIIGISAGFDNHKDDWGGLLSTEDYFLIGRMVKETCKACGAGYFALLEGGYNHKVLGQNVTALINGMSV